MKIKNQEERTSAIVRVENTYYLIHAHSSRFMAELLQFYATTHRRVRREKIKRLEIERLNILFSPSHPTLNYIWESVQLLLTQRALWQTTPNLQRLD